MFDLKGQFNSARIFAKNNEVDDSALEQIKFLLNMEAYKNSVFRIMPDVHAGMGCTIGTTMTVSDKISPNLVGVDIGCGVLGRKLVKKKKINFEKIDDIIRAEVPFGFKKHKKIKRESYSFVAQLLESNIDNLSKTKYIYHDNLDKEIKTSALQLGTLGSGNHFIEINVNAEGEYWLFVHSGSRNLGNVVANIFQKMAIEQNKELEKSVAFLNKDTYPDDYRDYLIWMNISQKFASKNRELILEAIMEALGFEYSQEIETVHNYIDLEEMILRKGAVSAKENELLTMPLNMRDGTLLCRGKGNKDWNFSAPHGAGRLMSRTKAHNNLSFDNFKKEMKDIYSTCITKKTLDEAPAAYKDYRNMLNIISQTVDVIEQLKPVYNFKAL